MTSASGPDGDPAVYVHAGTLISSAGRTVYRHDQAGRVVSKTRRLLSGGAKTWTYRWDARNRRVSTTTPDNTVWTYQYDPLGRRVGKCRLNGDGTIAEQICSTWDGSRLAAVSLGFRWFIVTPTTAQDLARTVEARSLLSVIVAPDPDPSPDELEDGFEEAIIGELTLRIPDKALARWRAVVPDADGVVRGRWEDETA